MRYSKMSSCVHMFISSDKSILSTTRSRPAVDMSKVDDDLRPGDSMRSRSKSAMPVREVGSGSEKYPPIEEGWCFGTPPAPALGVGDPNSASGSPGGRKGLACSSGGWGVWGGGDRQYLPFRAEGCDW